MPRCMDHQVTSFNCLSHEKINDQADNQLVFHHRNDKIRVSVDPVS